mmetsp:Transcript_19467/g.73568  ORF Transcript_19467/g.73568 Transcript_19467/m.73568 type:complete len:218 (+) Transcript_19467:1125-1778(+)|eukprot:scaffold8431_cov248-Pinguiococcus_pyrenoidosus.AAC.10
MPLLVRPGSCDITHHSIDLRQHTSRRGILRTALGDQVHRRCRSLLQEVECTQLGMDLSLKLRSLRRLLLRGQDDVVAFAQLFQQFGLCQRRFLRRSVIDLVVVPDGSVIVDVFLGLPRAIAIAQALPLDKILALANGDRALSRLLLDRVPSDLFELVGQEALPLRLHLLRELSATRAEPLLVFSGLLDVQTVRMEVPVTVGADQQRLLVVTFQAHAA